MNDYVECKFDYVIESSSRRKNFKQMYIQMSYLLKMNDIIPSIQFHYLPLILILWQISSKRSESESNQIKSTYITLTHNLLACDVMMVNTQTLLKYFFQVLCFKLS